jgi:hypothetical protein
VRHGAWIPLPGGGRAHVCYSGTRGQHCQFCRKGIATLECDFPVGQTLAGEPITCDAKMCGGCARPVGPDRDHCPNHGSRARRKTIRDPLTRKELDALGYTWVSVGECRGCHERIEWWSTPSGAKMPMTVRADDLTVNHWSICSARRQFRAANKTHADRVEKKKPQQTNLF